MDWSNLVSTVLVIVIGAGVKWVFKFLKVELDEKTFNAIVAAIVTVLLGLLGMDGARAAGLL